MLQLAVPYSPGPINHRHHSAPSGPGPPPSPPPSPPSLPPLSLPPPNLLSPRTPAASVGGCSHTRTRAILPAVSIVATTFVTLPAAGTARRRAYSRLHRWRE
ncbi:hypothetical protein AURDEDRAFT_164852 [Auricularia subglabra TFB-10046 SS5]|nr:hypothetical protein AURDEDRAFT_164852 [Auricularia subglabra TFB-10046 SS5]